MMRQVAIQKEKTIERDTYPPCRVVWLGRIGYQEAWDLQRALAAQRLAGEIPDTLLLLEHPPTITMGRGGTSAHIVATPEALESRGIVLVDTDRGGDVTYHGPGQLVGYPILNLQAAPHRPDLHAYLRALEETLIRALEAFDVAAGRFPGYTGVWTGMETPHPRKVAAIGIRVSRWITSHGFALNVCPDLTHFDVIVPCGIRDYGVTSLSRLLGREVSVTKVLPVVQSAFAEVFGFHSVSTR
jgi:lipoyl(octanoyl) transferase